MTGSDCEIVSDENILDSISRMDCNRRMIYLRWLERRETIKRLASSGPVDLDSGQQWSVDDGSCATYDNATLVSAATSGDRTPVLSNRLSIPSSQRRMMRTAVAPEAQAPVNPNYSQGMPSQATDDASTYATWSENQERRKHRRITASGFFDVNTRHGKVVFLLMFMLLLAIATIVVSALTSGRNDNNRTIPSYTDNESRPPWPGTVPFNPPSVAPANLTSDAPSQEPSALHVMDTPSPTNYERQVTSQPSFHPTASVSSLMPSMAPTTIPPTTLSPTTALPTTTPSTTPTMMPPPTANPTVSSSPTETPTFAPTASFFSMTWERAGQLRASPSSGPNSQFGSSVALSADGRVVAVGSPFANGNNTDIVSAGRVQVFHRTRDSSTGEEIWTLRGTPIAGRNIEDNAGSAVALNADGSILAISEPGAVDRTGVVRVFRFNGDDYELCGQELTGEGVPAQFGTALALSTWGTHLAIGAPFQSFGSQRLNGRAYVYEIINNRWRLMGEPLSGNGNLDWFGSALDLSEDGSILVVSAPRSPSSRGYVQAWKFDSTTEVWSQLGQNIENDVSPRQNTDRFGNSVSVSNMGNDVIRLAIGIPMKDVGRNKNAGIVVVYEMRTNRWVRVGDPVTASSAEEQFGFAVKLHAGRRLVVGAPGANVSGSVAIFQEMVGTWVQHPLFLSGSRDSDSFGHCLGFDGKWLVVGSPQVLNGGGSGYVGIHRFNAQNP